MSLQYFLDSIREGKVPNKHRFRHSSVYYTKVLLEARFSPRTFSIKEVEGLINEVFPPEDQIPQWYKDKWFK